MTAASTTFPDAARSVFERTGALLLLVDEEHRVVAANAAAAAAVGRTPGEATGADATTFVAAKHAPAFRHALREAVRGTASSQECALATTERKHRSIAWSVTLVSEVPHLVACIGVDVTAIRDEVENLRNRAVTDDLTGLPNRAALLNHLASVAPSGATVVFCDLNRFKAVNDTLGHAAGDAVLVQAARRLRRTVRGEDFVARLGGDEFVIVVSSDDDTSFDGLARRLLRAIEQPMVLPGGVAATVGMSVGEAILEPGGDPGAVLSAADADMYKMKSRLPTRTTGDAA